MSVDERSHLTWISSVGEETTGDASPGAVAKPAAASTAAVAAAVSAASSRLHRQFTSVKA